MDALVLRRQELKSQRREASERRQELLGQSILARDPGAKRAIDTRMQELDVRSARLDQEIMALDDAIATATGRGVANQTDPFEAFRRIATTRPPSRGNVGEMIATVAVGEALVFVLIGVLLWHTLWKRSLAKLRTTFAGADSSARLDQLQRAVDVIAVEVERISENQRYVTKMLSDKLQPALGVGDAQQLPKSGRVAESARLPDEG